MQYDIESMNRTNLQTTCIYVWAKKIIHYRGFVIKNTAKKSS